MRPAVRATGIAPRPRTLAACGASKAPGAGTAAAGGAAGALPPTAGGNLPIPAGKTAQAQLSALRGCKPTPQPGGQEYWLVSAGSPNPKYALPRATPKVGPALSGWPAAPAVVLGDCTNTESWVFLAGDSKNFYLAVQVDSTLPVVEGTSSAPWTGDVIQFAFDPADDMNQGSYDAADDEDGMILLGGQPFLFQNVQGGSEVTPFAIQGGQVSITRSGGITLYECSIPWSAIGSPVQPTFGFNVAVAAGGPPYQGPNWGYEWTQGIIEGKNPADFVQVSFKP
jgi:hypothetical protein